MPHTTSAEKRLRQTEKHRARNRASAKAIKLQVRAVHDALTGGDAGKAKTELVTAAKRLDKAAARGRIHKNKAARMKSRLAKRLNKAAAAAK
jgi:small subunit ribosomal protein S20